MDYCYNGICISYRVPFWFC